MTEPYGYSFAVLRLRPRARWTAHYDELYDGLTSGQDALTRDAASLALLESWSTIADPQGRKRLACLPHLTSNAYAT
jgi:hypothetical protein